jgi:Na+(H+)/acetate symporter ActP
VAHFKVAAPLIETLSGLSPEQALYVTAAVTLIAVLPGGMRSLTWTQSVQYFVIMLACLAPAGYLTAQNLGAGTAIGQDFGALLLGNLSLVELGATREIGLSAVVLGLGVAAHPAFLARAESAASSRDAVASMGWAFIFAVALVVLGLVFAQALGASGAEASAGGGGFMRLVAIFSVLPAVLAGLVVAGMLTALFALGQAALLSAGSALSHDVWDETLDTRGPEGRRILVARLILIALTASAVWLAPRWRVEA